MEDHFQAATKTKISCNFLPKIKPKTKKAYFK